MNEGAGAWPLSLRLVHWVTAVLVIGTLVLGVYVVQFVADTGRRYELTQVHKSIGIAVFALTVGRLCLRAVIRAPRPEPGAPMLLLAAKAAHIALYVLLLVMVSSGWMMTTTTPVRVPTVVFGLFQLPYPLAPNMAVYRIVRIVHVAAAISLAALIALHVAAALTHALFWGDRTLARMWRGGCRG